MRVLVGCETSGIVRRAFDRLGHDVWSCDLLPAEDGSNRHIVCDVRELLHDGWDLLAVLHPPCTRLCNSGVRWLDVPPPGRTVEEMEAELREAADLFSDCWNAPIERIAVENPIMHGRAKALIRNYEAPAQFVEPWWFGEPFFKRLGLWLRNLAPLTPTAKLTPPLPGTAEHKVWSRVHRMSGFGRDRRRERSRFFEGVANAMALQWSAFVGGLREAA